MGRWKYYRRLGMVRQDYLFHAPSYLETYESRILAQIGRGNKITYQSVLSREITTIFTFVSTLFSGSALLASCDRNIGPNKPLLRYFLVPCTNLPI